MKMRAVLCSMLLSLAGCEPPAEVLASVLAPTVAQLAEADVERIACRIAIARLQAREPAPGAAVNGEARVELLGRARGEPALFVAAPEATPTGALDRELAAASEALAGRQPDARLRGLVARFRHRPAALRRLALRDGYLYAEDLREAMALVRQLELADLFDEPSLWLQRGEQIHRLERSKTGGGFEYRHEGGQTAKLLLFDRVAAHRAALSLPLHRDIRRFRDREGFQRMQVARLGHEALLADLRYGDISARALLRADGAALEVECFDAPRALRQRIAAQRRADAPRRRAVAQLKATVDALVAEQAPFDRPREAEDHLSDGHLRPLWESAYRHGRRAFEHEGASYLVFDADGRPHPPQTCAAMIADAYERAAGNWYRPLGERRERTAGAIDFNELGIENRAGVLGLEAFAVASPSLFEVHRFEDSERVPFRDRKRFFALLREHRDGFEPGDILAIHGPKPDGYVHQHAILVADVDPLTGFPYALADQMKKPRIRTFENIMAEAPLRSMFYHLRPKPELLLRLDPEGADGRLAAAE